MKQQLWLLNSSLIVIFFGGIIAGILLHINPPVLQVSVPAQVLVIEDEKKETKAAHIGSDFIYKNDLFGTYIPQEIKPIKTSLVTPIPEMQEAIIAKIPEVTPQELIPALSLTVKGIIIGSNEAKNVVMIEDETKKEQLYHLGDAVKDAQIIKIARDRVVFLRTNGQHETFYLRKVGVDNDFNSPERWKYIIRKIEDNNFEIDPNNFKQEVESLGAFIDRLNIIGTAYENGNPIGVKIGVLGPDDLGTFLGLQQLDIIISVNAIKVADSKNRLKIYDAISLSKNGDVITVVVNRGGIDLTILYNLTKISKAKQHVFSEEKKPQDDAEALKMSKLQEREKQMRDFSQQHPNEQHRDAIAQLRKRLLDNLRTRLQHSQAH